LEVAINSVESGPVCEQIKKWGRTNGVHEVSSKKKSFGFFFFPKQNKTNSASIWRATWVRSLLDRLKLGEIVLFVFFFYFITFVCLLTLIFGDLVKAMDLMISLY
jgi:hypothetical protein